MTDPKPVTNAEAKRWKGYAAIGDDMLRLLTDREAMLEMIKQAAEMPCMAQGAATAATNFLYCEDCLTCQARNLVERMEGE